MTTSASNNYCPRATLMLNLGGPWTVACDNIDLLIGFLKWWHLIVQAHWIVPVGLVVICKFDSYSGRIVNMSSVRGLMPAMYGAAYNISKYGMETFSDILRLEMKKFDVTVCIIEPCSFGGVTKIFVSSYCSFLIKRNMDTLTVTLLYPHFQ